MKYSSKYLPYHPFGELIGPVRAAKCRRETKGLPHLLIACGEFLFRYRNIVFPVVAILLIVVFKPGRSSDGYHEILVDAVGLTLAVLGHAIHIVIFGSVPIRRGGHNKRPQADELLTSGYYAHCRNPIYTGNLLVIGGLLVVFNNIAAAAAALAIFTFSYRTIVAAEERYLAQRFGDKYELYRQTVPRWLPVFRGLSATIHSTPVNWRYAISKTYTSMYSWIVMLTLVLISKAWIFRGLGATLEPLALLGVFASCTVLFLLAHWLKKLGAFA